MKIEIEISGGVRVARFEHDIMVHQGPTSITNPNTLAMPTLRSNYRYHIPIAEAVEVHEEFTRALSLMCKWAEDAGKPTKEVLERTEPRT